MAYTERRTPGESSQAPTLPKLSSHELARVAGDHLTDLIDHEHRTASERPALSFPRSRRLGRTVALGVVSIRETFGSVWRWLKDPRHITGRLIARPRLWAPTKTFSLWSVLLLGFLVLVGYLRFFVFEGSDTTVRLFGLLSIETSNSHEPGKTITGGLFGATMIALLVLLWNDLVRLPYLAWKVRHRIIPRPERVLLPNLLAREARPLIEQIALDIVPRTELYEDLLPGVLVHGDKDVQIVMGEAGAGKTTALIAIAQLLAQNGIVPVLVPLRSHTETRLIDPAKDRFKKQVEAQVRSQAEADLLWRWLVLRRRVAILVDDIDQVGPDGERGLVLRKMLDEASESGLSVIVTARTAGVPAGMAASAIDLGSLGEGEAIDHVFKRARDDPSFSRGSRPSRRRIGEWVGEGRFVEVPFYLELLAGLAAVGSCPRLPQASSTAGGDLDTGRVYQRPDGEWAWNSLWVRFNLLEHYCEQLMLGNVKRSLGIQSRERRNTIQALEGAALGMLAASSLSARMKLKPHEGGRSETDVQRPPRTEIEQFILTDDRSGLRAVKDSSGDEDDNPAATQRTKVSAHEAIDAGERMGILDRRTPNEPTAFHHRIMQAYLAARCLVVREYEAEHSDGTGHGEAADEKRTNPVDRMPERERDWIAALLDHRHPDRLTAQMTLAFTAMRARTIAERVATKQEAIEQDGWNAVGTRIVKELVKQAKLVREGKQTEEDSRERDRMLVTLVTESEAEATQLTLALSPEQAREAAVPPERRKAALPDPLYRPDFEQRSDPDDALTKLTTAAEIVRAVPATAKAIKGLSDGDHKYESIAAEIKLTPGPTRWTKLRAIEALAVPSDPDEKKRTSTEKDMLDALGDRDRWQRIWEFARDPDYDVKRGASTALEENAFESFKSLAPDIEELIARAAARSSYGRWLVRPERADGRQANGSPYASSLPTVPALLSLLTGEANDLPTTDLMSWKVGKHVDALKALGAVMPAIVSGFREDPSIELESSWPAGCADGTHATADGATAADGEGPGEREANEVMCHHPPIHSERIDYARRARSALEALVALAFEGRHGDLEAAVAQGFRSDALRHAQDPRRSVTGPGWVMSNRQLVAGICLDHTTFWYARLVLYQTLDLYAIAGADAQETLDILAWHTRRGGRDHQPFTRRTARLARAALRRHQLHSGRWLAYVWGDEGTTTSRRASQLTKRSAQLLADVTILLNLNQSAAEDRQDAFVQMQDLPFCLSASHDRSEILGEGCPPRCGWNLCPYQQAPPDEPDGYRGVRRSFCRQQREIARAHRPRWQRSIGKKKLREFWREMELRART